jgi:hypothetical protein
MFINELFDVLLTPAPRRLGNINPSRAIGNGRKTSDTIPSPDAKRLGMIALIVALRVWRETLSPKRAKESIDVPPHSRLLLRAVGRGDQVYGCVYGRWALINLYAPGIKTVAPCSVLQGSQ